MCYYINHWDILEYSFILCVCGIIFVIIGLSVYSYYDWRDARDSNGKFLAWIRGNKTHYNSVRDRNCCRMQTEKPELTETEQNWVNFGMLLFYLGAVLFLSPLYVIYYC